MTEMGKGKVESGKWSYRFAKAATARSFHFRLSPFPCRRQALTLVELMVAIAIMGILATLLLGAAAVASEAARNARTKSLIARLHTLLMERYDGYRTQRVEVQPFTDTAAYRAYLASRAGFVYPSPPNALADPLPSGPGDPRIGAYARLAGLREIMKFEMPDRWSDVLGMAVPGTPTQINQAMLPSPLFLQTSPSLRGVYLRAYNRAVANGATQAQIVDNESAECLYLVIMNATGDGEAPGMFKPTDIGDTDGDGAPEFLDGWGKPIQWLRWAPGFDSDAQLSFRSLERTASDPRKGSNIVAEQLLADHDPFDLFRLDPPAGSGLLRGWRLVPLVTSGGGDEEIGIRFDGEFPGVGFATLDPFDDVMNAGGTQSLGEAIDADLAADDITNHNVGALSRK